MGVGPNYGLGKGFLAQGASAYLFGQPVASGTVEQSCKAITVANTRVLGISQETVDAAKIATGKHILTVWVTGISRVIAGAAIAKDDPLTVDATGRAIKQVTAGGLVFGIAQTACTAANQHVDVLLTPGATLTG